MEIFAAQNNHAKRYKPDHAEASIVSGDPTQPALHKMSEPPPIIPKLEHSGDTPVLPEEEKTQPTEEILNALRQLNPQSFATPAKQNGSGDLSGLKQEPTPPPPSEWDTLRAQLRQKPYDADSWLKLVDIAEDSGDIEKLKATYEGLLEAYPNTVRNSFMCSCTQRVSQFSLLSPRLKLRT